MSHPQVVHPKELIKIETGFKRFNQLIAIKLGNSLGSMLFFWFCLILDLVELPPVIASNNLIVWINYIAQTVIQLLALPILGVVANLQQKQSEAKANADHKTLTYLAEIQDEQLVILKELKEK